MQPTYNLDKIKFATDRPSFEKAAGIYDSGGVDDFKEASWNMLDLIYCHTKQPGKQKDYPPVAMKKGTTVKGLATLLHHDFIDKFRYARVWGKSARFSGQRVGLNHILQEEDVIELHLK